MEVGEKYRKAMVSNAQLDNEKSNLMYQVDTLKDSLSELEELLAEARRQYEEKSKVRPGPTSALVRGVEEEEEEARTSSALGGVAFRYRR